jgi:hypothetical protein
MKKIGILHGKESSFPEAFVNRINAKNIKGIHAEPTLVDELMQGNPSPYAVMIDRISQDVPFYRAYLKNTALNGTAVLNNPFWWSADEKFFNNCLSTKIGVPVPKTILLPSKEMPPDTSGQSFRNLKYPLAWEEMIDYLGGFPLFMKPHSGGGWKNVYKVENFDEFLILMPISVAIAWAVSMCGSWITNPAIHTIFAMWQIIKYLRHCAIKCTIWYCVSTTI